MSGVVGTSAVVVGVLLVVTAWPGIGVIVGGRCSGRAGFITRLVIRPV